MKLSKLQELLQSGVITPEELAVLESTPAGRVLVAAVQSVPAEDPQKAVEARFRELADSAPVLVWQTDEHGAVFMNREYRDYIGKPLRELVGMGWATALHPDDAETYVADYLAAFAKRERFEAQFRFRRFDGDYRWHKTVGLPRYEDGRFIGYVGSCFDITDIKSAAAALEERHRWFAEIADVAPGILWVTDSAGVCTYLSHRWYETTGQAEDAGLGFGWLDATHPEDKPRTDAAFQQALVDKKAFGFEYRLRTRDGTYKWCMDQGEPRFSRDGTFLGHVGQVIDISERKLAELERAQASVAIEEANRRKDQFIATLAHELRNPLAPIATGIHIVRKAPEDPAAQKALSVMERQLSSMVRLIDDLMDVSRITRGKVELQREPLDIRSSLERAQETVQVMFDSSQQTLLMRLPEQPMWVEGDNVRLTQVFTNLLTNASRYSPPKTRVEVSLTLSSARDAAVVTIADEGWGIPQDKLESVFEMFSPVNGDLGRPSSGLGIGLSLARKLIEMHGGHISAWSAGLNRGSTFTVDLPLVRAAPRAIDGPVQEADRAAGRRILIVDDNVDAADSLAIIFGLGGHEAKAVHGGRDAIDAATSYVPEVILLDIGLPDLNGYEVCRRLKKEPVLAGTKFVALSGWGSDEDKRKGTEAGFHAHLTKPANPKEIEAVMEELFRRH
jgi:PAS domain S-box-containing protein